MKSSKDEFLQIEGAGIETILHDWVFSLDAVKFEVRRARVSTTLCSLQLGET